MSALQLAYAFHHYSTRKRGSDRGKNTLANPQKENGYTPIANEILEALARFRIPGELRQVVDAILRKTYGYNKGFDSLANSQIVEITGMKRQNVSRSITRLVENRIVIRTDDNNGKGNILGINKDYERWISFVIRTDDKKKIKKVSSKRIRASSELITKVIKTDDKVSSELMDTKDKNILKDNLQKTSNSGKAPKELLRGDQWNILIDGFRAVNPMYEGFYRMKTHRGALQEIVKAIGFDKTRWIVENLQKITSMPYAPKVTTPTQLKSKLGELQTFLAQERMKKEGLSGKGRGLVE